jgi:hypothetical protein
MSAAGTGSGSPARNGKQEDEILYTVDDVVISTTTARFGSTLYSMNNINSVKLSTFQPFPGNIFIQLSFGLKIGGAMGIVSWRFIEVLFGDEPFSVATGVVFLIWLSICIYLDMLGKRLNRDAKPIYYVSISTSGGDVAARQSEDKEYIFGIVCAIQDAMQKGVKAYT